MSVWPIGVGRDDAAEAREAGDTLKRYIDKITV
jgi:hypothetical protein